ncbi:DUF2784 domain-containing protein [Nocardiopsis coralliicola]
MLYTTAGTVAAALHFAFLAFVVFGGFLAWRWPRLLVLHAAVAAYALGIVIVGWPCFLTEIENWARAGLGQPVMHNGFIDHYLTGTLYPPDHLLTSRIVMGAVIAVSWAAALVRHGGALRAPLAGGRADAGAPAAGSGAGGAQPVRTARIRSRR